MAKAAKPGLKGNKHPGINQTDPGSPDDPFLETSTAPGSRLKSARLYETTFSDHIVVERERLEFLAVGPDKIVDTIQNATAVHKSSTRPDDTDVFISETNTYGGHAMHVPVRAVKGNDGTGFVVTAYFSSRPYPGEKLTPEKKKK